MKGRTAFGILLLVTVSAFAQDKPGAVTKWNPQAGQSAVGAGAAAASNEQQGTAGQAAAFTLGDAHVIIPPGWKHVETKPGVKDVNGLLIFPPDNTQQRNLVILLMPAQDLRGANFTEAVDAVLKKALAPNEHLVQYSELPLRKAAGYEFLTRAMVVANDAGRRMFRICFSANPSGRLQMLMVSSDSLETVKHYETEVSSVLNSYSFGEAPAAADAPKQESATQQAPPPAAQPQPGGTAARHNTALAGKKSRVPEGESVLLCIDAKRLDGAMDFAKYGDSYNALRALRHDNFFRVNGPASLEVKESELDSRWPKVFVTVLDGDLAGRTGWVVLSELKDLKAPAK